MPVKAFLKFSWPPPSPARVPSQAHQPAHVAVGRLQHGVEVVCGPPVHLADPGQQHRDGL